MLLMGTTEGILEIATDFDRRSSRATPVGRRRLPGRGIAAIAAWKQRSAALTDTGDLWVRGWFGWRQTRVQWPVDSCPTALAISSDQALWAGGAPARIWRQVGSQWEGRSALLEEASAHEWWGAEDQAKPRVTALSPDPRDPDALLIAIAVGGIYATSDQGRHWTSAHEGITPLAPPEATTFQAQREVIALTRHPHFPDIVYAATGSAHYQRDRVRSAWRWRDVTPNHVHTLHGLPGAIVPLPAEREGALAMLPLEGDPTQMTLWRTADGGRTWSVLSEAPYFPFPSSQDVSPCCHILVDAPAERIVMTTPAGDLWWGTLGGHWRRHASDLGPIAAVAMV